MECLRKIYRIFLYIYLFLLKNTSNNIFFIESLFVPFFTIPFRVHQSAIFFSSSKYRFDISKIVRTRICIYIFFNLFQNKSLFFLLYPLGKIFTNFRIFTQTKHHIWKHMCRASIWQSIYIYIAINLTLWRKV